MARGAGGVAVTRETGSREDRGHCRVKRLADVQSQLDWKSHTASTVGMSDELASNRRAGGYLEKRDFLERVDDRRGGTFDSQRKGR
jgi:hypothetical protein